MSGAAREEEKTVNVNTDGAEDTIIEIVDDRPPEDRREPAPKARDAALPDDDELSQYSEGVQKRLKQLSHQVNENRRVADEQRRVADEAATAIQRVLEENKQLRGMVTSGEKVLVDQAGKRVEAQLAAAEQELRKATEEGDTEKLIKAQRKLAELAAEAQQVKTYTPTRLPEETKFQPRQAPNQQVQDWRSKNPWFMQDRVMTSLAIGLHEDLVRKGVSPESKEYYEAIDDGMRKRFPEKFDAQDERRDAPVKRPQGTVVAPVTRTGERKTSQTVKLTATQVSLAKRLGITPQQYAEQVLKDSRG